MSDPIVRKIVEKMYPDEPWSSDEVIAPPISVQALADWLVGEGLAEDRRGYGHATGEQVAEALLARFNVTVKT